VTHQDLDTLVTRFTDAFNADDLDGVMSYIGDGAIYDQFDGTQARGKDEIRKAF
jgi:ketosteroid isomerase-like protein